MFRFRLHRPFHRLDDWSSFQGQPIERLVFWISVLWVACLLFVWDVQIMLSLDANYLMPVIFDLDALSNAASWLVLGDRLTAGELLTAENQIGHFMSKFLLPLGSLAITSVLISVMGNATTLILFAIILPVASYIYFVRIYHLFLPLRWSIFLAALGILTIAEYPFRDFLIGLINGDVGSKLPILDHPSVLGHPFPSLSLFVFAVLLYYSVVASRTGGWKLALLSVFWGLQGYIHILNLAFGAPLWLMLLFVRALRRLRIDGGIKVWPEFLLNVSIVCILFTPILTGVLTTDLHMFHSANVPSDWFTVSAYMIMPLVLLGVAVLAYRVDPYELLVKFHLVWITMLVELCLIVLWQSFQIGLPTDIIAARLGIYFLHLFYFVPAIYYANRSFVKYYHGVEALSLSKYIRLAFSGFFQRCSILYLPALCGLLTIFILMGADNVRSYFDNHVKIDYERVSTESLPHKKGGSMTQLPPSQSAAAEIYRMRSTIHDVTWMNIFTDSSSLKQIVDHFASYAQVSGWTKEEYLHFMSYNPNLNRVLPSEVYKKGPVHGLGHWLITNSLFPRDYGKFAYESLVQSSFDSAGEEKEKTK